MLYLILTALSFYCATTTDEFANFGKLIEDKYQDKVRGQVAQAASGRVADPCRMRSLIGKQGTLPNSASRKLAELGLLANKAEKQMLKKGVAPESAAKRCKEAIQHNKKNFRLNLEICAEALAYYRRRSEEERGRSSGGSPWDELMGNLQQSLTVDEILGGLDIWDAMSLVFLIDNTGSMEDDINQVSQIAEQFVISSRNNHDDLVNNFVIMSFGDPDIQDPTAYWEPTHAMNHVENNIIASMGGDCPENTCQALDELLMYNELCQSSPVYVFTDATSKDCSAELVNHLATLGSTFEWKLNFVLTGTCNNEPTDGNFTYLAEQTGGSIFHIKGNEIYLLSDIIQDSVHSSIGELPYIDETGGEDWSLGRKKRDLPSNLARLRRAIQFAHVSFYVDETVGKLTVQVTFDYPADKRVLDKVQLVAADSTISTHSSRSVGKCTEPVGQKVGNIVHYAMHCPCVGEWRLSIPFDITNHWSFSAKTFGEFSIEFDAMFEQDPPSQYSDRSKQPCVGERSLLWVSITQEESIQGDDVTLIMKIDKKQTQLRLVRSNTHKGYWTTTMRVPEDPFTLAIRGTTIEGNMFLRLLNTEINPTTTCLRTVRISPSQNTIKAGGRTDIIMALKNKDTPKPYTIHCLNDRQKDGFKTKITRPRWKYEEMSRLDTEVNRYYYIYIQVKAPPVVEVGEIVVVKCFAYSNNSVSVFKSYEIMIASPYA